MPPVHFTVTQLRTAAACPRILYFDAVDTRDQQLKQPAVTRIWKTGAEDEGTACGSLFHAAIEQFNGQAAGEPQIRQLLETAEDSNVLAQGLLAHIYQQHVNREALFKKTAAQQQAFMEVLRRYVSELADILVHAKRCGKRPEDVLAEMFGDRRRRVDVTFAVGPTGEPVHVTGILDYVFYDWRTTHNRIIDYKLTPADQPTNDLFQVCIYALMHHVQHRTEPDVGVLYLHPARQMVEKAWEQVFAERHVVFNLLASMREWVRYDEVTGQGLKPPGEPVYCGVCRWNEQCVQRLGPKHEGGRLSHWTDSSPRATLAEPPFTVHDPETGPKGEVSGHPAPRSSPIPSGPAALPPENTLWLGHTLHDERPVGLPCAALPTHVAVVGAAGSGKTWLAKVLAEEAIGQQVPVLAIDPQGDLVQFLKRREPDAFPADHRPRYEQFWQLAEPRVFTPGSSHGIRVCLSPIRLLRPDELHTFPDPQRRREEVDSLLTTVAGNLISLAKSGGDADCQRTFLFQVLQRLTGTAVPCALSLGDVAAAASQPAAVGIEDADRFIKKAERERLARKLNNLLFGPLANLFTSGQSLDLDSLLRSTQPGKVPLNILYLNALPDDEQKQFFLAALAAEVYRWMVTNGSRATGPQVLFYLDEARDYLPAGARKPPAKEPLLRLFAQGRKYGVACLLCTQSPRSVDYQVFGNCSTKIIGRLESSQDVERVAEWFGKEGPTPAWLHTRKGAETGTFLGRWPGLPNELERETWKSRCLFSLHGGAWSPERVEQETRADMCH
jgi:CRISPR/Cas system-associated exonuclease Cas4 (RecB family)